MQEIHFHSKNTPAKTVALEPGQRLWDAAVQGISFVTEPNCGGVGRCRKCLCKVNGSELKLSCQEKVQKDTKDIQTLVYYTGHDS